MKDEKEQLNSSNFVPRCTVCGTVITRACQEEEHSAWISIKDNPRHKIASVVQLEQGSG